jgi:large subunit ribosomal protein L25
MSIDFVLNAEWREEQGKGASRRLRHAGKIPAILYGAGSKPIALSLDQNAFLRNLEHEAFYSHVLTIKFNGTSERAILRDLQRHPSKATILHVDLQRVLETEELRVAVPLHFIGEEVAYGVKMQGGNLSHLMTEAEVACLPANLPEYIDVDVSNLHVNDSIRLSEVKLPEGVSFFDLTHGTEQDHILVTVYPPRGEGIETGEGSEEEKAPGE